MFLKLALLSSIWETVFSFAAPWAFAARSISKESASGGGIGQVSITADFRHSNLNWIPLTCAFHAQKTLSFTSWHKRTQWVSQWVFASLYEETSTSESG